MNELKLKTTAGTSKKNRVALPENNSIQIAIDVQYLSVMN
jgi:hypothetical protein